jgi:GrpB-like predicted nucleotidyltransferase (UPF0157 family)
MPETASSVASDGKRWSNAGDDFIEIVPFDPTWPERFEAEAGAIVKAL